MLLRMLVHVFKMANEPDVCNFHSYLRTLLNNNLMTEGIVSASSCHVQYKVVSEVIFMFIFMSIASFSVYASG